jgi:hypothetical protein
LTALVPAIFFSLKAETDPGGSALSSRFADQMVASPSAFFSLAMMLAGILAWHIGLLPRGISFSLGRLTGAALIGFLAYPIGFFAILGAVLVLFGAIFSGSDTSSRSQAAILGHIVGYLTSAGIIFVGGLLTILIVTAAFAVATRYWPRFAFRWIILLIGTTISGSTIAGIIHYRISLPMLPNSFLLRNFLSDPVQVFFGVAWGLPLVVLVGEPLLAALVGHWLYLAAVEWSAESA